MGKKEKGRREVKNNSQRKLLLERISKKNILTVKCE